MRQGEREAAAQKQSDHQRWADDGGFTPEQEVAEIRSRPSSGTRGRPSQSLPRSGSPSAG
jgi:hypothetical protein